MITSLLQVYVPFGVAGAISLVLLGKCSDMACRNRKITMTKEDGRKGGGGSSAATEGGGGGGVAAVIAVDQNVTFRRVMLRRRRMALVLLCMFLVTAFCNVPFLILARYFPAVLVRFPLLTMWFRMCLTGQYTLCPVN